MQQINLFLECIINLEEYKLILNMQKQKKIEFRLEKEDPKVKSKLIKLLRKYNATLQFNSQQNLYEIDVEVKFSNQNQKSRFIQTYVGKEKRRTLEEIHQNNYIEMKQVIQDLKKQKIDINLQSIKKNQEFSEEVNREMEELKNQKTIAQKQFSNKEIKQQQNQAIEKKSQISQFNSKIDYNKLNKKLHTAIDDIYDILKQSTIQKKKRYNGSGSRNKDIVIIQEEENQQELFQNQSPIHSKQNQSLIRELNNQIRIQQSEFKRDFNKYFVESIIQEQNPSEFSSQAELERRKKDHFSFLERRFQKSTSRKKGTNINNQSLLFDEKKFNQFIKTNKKKINNLFDDLKKKLRISNYNSNQKTILKNKKNPVNYSNPKKGVNNDDIDLWRSELDSSIATLNDQNQQFESKFYKEYQTQIIAQNKNLNSEELIKYFKFLIKHAKKLYIEFLKQGNKK